MDGSGITRAAGILITCDGKALFLQRGNGGDHAGEWCFPGGHIEEGETAEQAAEREAREELGNVPYSNPTLLTRRIADGVDYTTFIAKANDEFAPKLNGEHTAWCWAPFDNPPQPLHPGCAIALARPGMNELDIARAISTGDLVSPQRYENIWLWEIRITGTGASYREGLNEYVWRDARYYMTEDFMSRCAGLSVVWEHPEKKAKLDSKEFNDRVIGAVMFAYPRGDEVWAVARIYDDDAATLMLNEQFSTSPGVVFKASSGNKSVPLEDGSHLLLEGKPALLDHIAIVANGVWDKGLPPTGVTTTFQQEPIGMTDEEKAVADKARKDADDLAAKLDAALSKLDAAHARLDAMDKARKDADAEREEKAARERDEGEKERARADKARRDAARKDRFAARKDGEDDAAYKARCDADEDAERKANEEDGDEENVAADKARKARKDAEDRHERERADRARKDAEEKERMDSAAIVKENESLKARLEAVEGVVAHLTRETPAEERNALAAAQARADGIAGLFGERAAAPMPGESSTDYRKRLVAKFKQHSPKFADADLSRLDAAVLGPIEDIIYNDAASAAKNPTRAGHGVVIPITTRENGRDVTRFTGDPLGWMAPFMLDGISFRVPERRAS